MFRSIVKFLAKVSLQCMGKATEEKCPATEIPVVETADLLSTLPPQTCHQAREARDLRLRTRRSADREREWTLHNIIGERAYAREGHPGSYATAFDFHILFVPSIPARDYSLSTFLSSPGLPTAKEYCDFDAYSALKEFWGRFREIREDDPNRGALLDVEIKIYVLLGELEEQNLRGRDEDYEMAQTLIEAARNYGIIYSGPQIWELEQEDVKDGENKRAFRRLLGRFC